MPYHIKCNRSSVKAEGAISHQTPSEQGPIQSLIYKMTDNIAISHHN